MELGLGILILRIVGWKNMKIVLVYEHMVFQFIRHFSNQFQL